MSPMVPLPGGETDRCVHHVAQGASIHLSGKVREESQSGRHLKVKDEEEFIMCMRLGAGREERTSRWREWPLQKHVGERQRKRGRQTETEKKRDGRETQREMERKTDRRTKMERD